MKRYPIIVERAESGFGAYSPDVPGCFATGKTVEDVQNRMMNALTGHVAFLEDDGKTAPEATTVAAAFLLVPTRDDAASAA